MTPDDVARAALASALEVDQVVRAGVATSNGAGLDQVNLPLPVVYRGELTVPGATAGSLSKIPGALISAYIYMKGGAYTADPTQADSVLQIAETRSDENGVFEVLIPAALNAARN